MIQEKLHIKSIDGHQIPSVLHTNEYTKIHSNYVILVHGIFSNKDERGRFIRQAEIHAQHGFNVIRFDYRGHGEHPVLSSDSSISGMIIDLKSVIDYISLKNTGELYVVASSFGASLMLLYLQLLSKTMPDKIILLNPVIDYVKTFLDPILQWGRDLITKERLHEIEKTGYMTLENDFKMNIKMFTELNLYMPHSTFTDLYTPICIIHGDKDSKVPYSITEKYAVKSKLVDLYTIKNADHAFKTIEHEKESFHIIEEWLYGKSS